MAENLSSTWEKLRACKSFWKWNFHCWQGVGEFLGQTNWRSLASHLSKLARWRSEGMKKTAQIFYQSLVGVSSRQAPTTYLEGLKIYPPKLAHHISGKTADKHFCLTLAKENWGKQSCGECCPCRLSRALLRLQNRAAADQRALMNIKRDCISWNCSQTLCCTLKRDRSTRIVAACVKNVQAKDSSLRAILKQRSTS